MNHPAKQLSKQPPSPRRWPLGSHAAWSALLCALTLAGCGDSGGIREPSARSETSTEATQRPDARHSGGQGRDSGSAGGGEPLVAPREQPSAQSETSDADASQRRVGERELSDLSAFSSALNDSRMQQSKHLANWLRHSSAQQTVDPHARSRTALASRPIGENQGLEWAVDSPGKPSRKGAEPKPDLQVSQRARAGDGLQRDGQPLHRLQPSGSTGASNLPQGLRADFKKTLEPSKQPTILSSEPSDGLQRQQRTQLNDEPGGSDRVALVPSTLRGLAPLWSGSPANAILQLLAHDPELAELAAANRPGIPLGAFFQAYRQGDAQRLAAAHREVVAALRNPRSDHGYESKIGAVALWLFAATDRSPGFNLPLECDVHAAEFERARNTGLRAFGPPSGWNERRSPLFGYQDLPEKHNLSALIHYDQGVYSVYLRAGEQWLHLRDEQITPVSELAVANAASGEHAGFTIAVYSPYQPQSTAGNDPLTSQSRQPQLAQDGTLDKQPVPRSGDQRKPLSSDSSSGGGVAHNAESSELRELVHAQPIHSFSSLSDSSSAQDPPNQHPGRSDKDPQFQGGWRS